MRRSTLSVRCAIALAAFAALPAHADVFVNEIHYDNAGTDVGEAIEIVASAGESLSGYQVVLYNGSNNASYSTTAVPAGNVVACGGQVRLATINYPLDGLQNGSPDGIALIDPQGNVVQFLSYEGAMTASNGPAAGLTSTDIGVFESNMAPVGTSLQLGGTGNTYASFSWADSATQTFGTCNNNQSFGEAGNAAPRVTTTFPANGGTDFPYAADLSVTFSEPVVAQPGAFVLACDGLRRQRLDLDHVAQATTFALTPAKPLVPGQACSLLVDATHIADLDGAALEADTDVAFKVKLPLGGGNGGAGYYGLVNTSSPGQLRCSLHETINGHVAYPYSGSGTSTWTILEIADEDPNDAGKILDVYRNRSYTKGTDRAGSGGSNKYNREHTWPNSLGFPSTTGNKGFPNAPYTDAHMLYLSDELYNSNRGNMPFDNCTQASGCTERVTEANNGRGGGSGTYPGNSNWFKGPNGNQGSFEAWGARKGDMARAVLYMAIRYEGGVHPTNGQAEPDLELTNNRSLIVGTSSSPAYMGMLSTLLDWHAGDPPDDAERARNEVVAAYQGNRNPFIDHPEWASNALFTSTTPTVCELGTPGGDTPRNPKLRPPYRPSTTATPSKVVAAPAKVSAPAIRSAVR
ncbi:endonuclease [Luteimonas sp. MC1572]|uniref:endonuclease n=1 Tax=Luteimonas sp. MC1572 TaxID=2799325 RepID=UPI0018F08726|nr:endonuclease [Luteimonas sp. MC1572]MBJ6982316.1 endonuclease [Luteimonas sp. MC1572]QQO03585.1 endonuclease [Luteimonas sp. MC1572]